MRSTQFMRALSWFVLLALVATMAPPALSSTDGLKQQDGGIVAWSGAVLAENRLTSVSGAATATFVYDGDGNRVKATFGATTTVYVGNHYERDNGSTVRQYYYAGGVRVAMRSGGQTYYLLGDHLGGTNVTANSSGAELGRVLYRPWGEMRLSTGTTPTTWRFTGQREDATIGLYFYNARYLDPQLGRFVQPDTIVPEPSDPQALNRYSYVFNNPVRYRDPSGHWVESALDLAFIAYDIYDIKTHGLTWESGLSLAADVGGLLLPVVTGGGLLVRGVAHADDLARVVSHGDEAVAAATIGRQVAEEAVESTARQAGRQVSQEVVERAVRSEVKPARALARERIPDTDVHHLIEKRFAGIVGVKAGDLPAIRLERTFHQQEVTSRLFSGGLGLPTGGSYSTQQIWDAYVRVYGRELRRQDWLDAIWPYFERLGVQR